MRKLSNYRKKWLNCRERRKHRVAIRNAGKEKAYFYKNGARLAQIRPIFMIRVPRDLASETEELRAKIRDCVLSAMNALREGQRIRLDFTHTHRAYPGGMLMLLAYIELMLELYPSRITATSSRGTLITQLLQHFGFSERLSLNRGGTPPTHESVLHWRFLTGTQADGAKITELLEAYKSLSDSEIPQGLYDVLAEALTNVRHHAYPPGEEGLPESLRKWWLFARYSSPSLDKQGSLYIAVYDIGVGIQASLRKKLTKGEIILDKADVLLEALRLGDANFAERLILKRAVEDSRTSTGLSFRGNGLTEMKDFVMGTSSGRMYITSGKAQYTCVAETRKSEAFGCSSTMLGTLIVWAIPLGISKMESDL